MLYLNMGRMPNMKSVSDRGILRSDLQVFRVQVPLAVPLNTGYMERPGTERHEGRVAIGETAHHTGAAANLPVERFYGIVGTDASPMFAGKIAVGKLSTPI